MTKSEFLTLVQSKIVILDGATGSNLQKYGMTADVCPEKWILEHRDVMIELQKEYIKAGSDILYVPTFTGNAIKLKEYGLEKNIASINRELVQVTKDAIVKSRTENKTIQRPIYLAGDLTMTGQQLYPMGTLTFEALIDVYKEQIGYLAEAGVDLFVVETMMSLQESRAAVLAVKEMCDLPIMVTLTFNEDGHTLYGTDPKTAILVLQGMGVDAVGVNCSTGPDKMLRVIQEMKQYGTIPIVAKPNAGLPHFIDGNTIYDMSPKEFAHGVYKLIEAGAGIVGGCCGTTPEHIQELVNRVKDVSVPFPSNEKIRAVTTERTTLTFDLDSRFLIVGERINPTGKAALQEELLAGSFDLVTEMAEEQEENGANLLDVNMGMNGIDEKSTMINAIYEITKISNLPLCIDSSHIDVIEAALRIYPGRALINSISLELEKYECSSKNSEEETDRGLIGPQKGLENKVSATWFSKIQGSKLEKMIQLAKKYGAMFILLPVSDSGIPKNLAEKKEIINKIVDIAIFYGLSKEDIVVDGLVNTLGANKMAGLETMETIQYCKQELGLATICGLSNISFGLPERQFVNNVFLALAIRDGLTMAIANPSQELLTHTAFAADLLLNKEESAIRYIEQVTKKSRKSISARKDIDARKDSSINTIKDTDSNETSSQNGEKSSAFCAVVKGDKKHIIDFVKQELSKGQKPSDILDGILIPAINEVGTLFDKQIYFLPQLISSAEVMKTAVDYLEPMLQKGKDSKKLSTIVMATVAGDIHDIGKNLVVLMLKNYGFHVIDLGKDISAVDIVAKARETKADIIGLSALMTTTMMEMKHVIDLAKAEGVQSKIIIGGAVITQSFAEEIGADGYSKDAQDAVKLVKKLLADRDER